MENMKYDWENWNFGGRIIFVAACAAIMSIVMKWVDIGIASQTGFSQGTFLLLGLWVYPVLMIFKNKVIEKSWGLACSIISVVGTLGYISSKSIDLFGETVNVAANGAWLFLIASVALVVGVVKYTPGNISKNNSEPGAGSNS